MRRPRIRPLSVASVSEEDQTVASVIGRIIQLLLVLTLTETRTRCKARYLKHTVVNSNKKKREMGEGYMPAKQFCMADCGTFKCKERYYRLFSMSQCL